MVKKNETRKPDSLEKDNRDDSGTGVVKDESHSELFRSKSDTMVESGTNSERGNIIKRDAGGREGDVVSESSTEAMRDNVREMFKREHKIRYYYTQLRGRWVASKLVVKALYLTFIGIVCGLGGYLVNDGFTFSAVFTPAIAVPVLVVAILEVPNFTKTIMALFLVSPTFWATPTLVNAIYADYRSTMNPSLAVLDNLGIVVVLYASGFAVSVLTLIILSQRKFWLSLLILGYSGLILGGALTFLFPQFFIYNVYTVFLGVVLFRCDFHKAAFRNLEAKIVRKKSVSTWVAYLEKVEGGDRNKDGVSFDSVKSVLAKSVSPSVLFSQTCNTINVPYLNKWGEVISHVTLTDEGKGKKETMITTLLEEVGCEMGNTSVEKLSKMSGLLVSNVRVPHGGKLHHALLTNKGLSLIAVLNHDGPLVENFSYGIMFKNGEHINREVEGLTRTRDYLCDVLKISPSKVRIFVVFAGKKIPPRLVRGVGIYPAGAVAPVGYAEIVTPYSLKSEISKGKEVFTNNELIHLMHTFTTQWEKIRYTPIPLQSPTVQKPPNPSQNNYNDTTYAYLTTAGTFTGLKTADAHVNTPARVNRNEKSHVYEQPYNTRDNGLGLKFLQPTFVPENSTQDDVKVRGNFFIRIWETLSKKREKGKNDKLGEGGEHWKGNVDLLKVPEKSLLPQKNT